MNTTRGSWQEDPQGLHQLFCFADFDHALAFTVAVGRLAKAADHHPDIDIRFNQVALSLITHDAAQVTEKDHSLAQAIDRLSPAELADGLRRLL